MRLSNSSTFRMDVSSRAISFSSTRVRAWRVVRVCRRAFSIPTAMREPISVSSRLCSSVKRPASCVSRFSTPMTRFLTISGMASSERTLGSAGDVLGMLGDIVDQNGLAPLRRQPGDALANS